MIRLLLVALALLMPVPAHAGTIVFDFEDGLQGWFPLGSAQRVQTQLLGGEWAIFGDGFVAGGANMTFSAGLDELEGLDVTFDVFIVEGDGSVRESFSINLGGFDGVPVPVSSSVSLRWGGVNEGRVVAFIDNITFHTIPEPSVLMLLALSGTAMLAASRGRNRA